MSEKGQATIAGVREIAAERPDFVYRDVCAYVWRGQPGCIVGHGLWRAGLINEDFEGSNLNELNVTVFAERDWGFSEDEINWLGYVQGDQDSGKSWGAAVRKADLAMARNAKIT